MATDWAEDVRRYEPDADQSVIDNIVKYLGIALSNRDTSLVAFKDPKELQTVKDNYLRGKLGLTDADDVLDAGIAAVGERLKGVNFKKRPTVYYLLAQQFNRLSVFGGMDGVSGAAGLTGGALAGGAAAAAGLGAAASVPDPEPSVAAAAAPMAAMHTPEPEVERRAAPPVDTTAYGTVEEGSGGGMRWLWWLLLAAGVLALLYALSQCSGMQSGADRDAAAGGAATEESASTTADGAEPAAEPAADGAGAATADAAAAVTIPGGEGVVSEMRDGKPALRVYFPTAVTAVPAAFGGSATALASYMTANPDATIAISGFNDPRGNAARNEALARDRAMAVQAGLVQAGIAEDRIELVRPEAATDTSVSLDEARRVEVVVR